MSSTSLLSARRLTLSELQAISHDTDVMDRLAQEQVASALHQIAETAQEAARESEQELAENIDDLRQIRRTMTPLVSQDPQLPFRLAAYCIEDALAGRKISSRFNCHSKSHWHQRALSFQTSRAFSLVYVATIFLFTFAAYWEEDWRALGFSAAALALLVLYTDLLCDLAYTGVKAFFLQPYNILLSVAVVASTIDFALFASEATQPFKFLRPFLLLRKDVELSRVVHAVFFMMPDVLPAFALIFIFLLFFAAIGIHIFPEDYNQANVNVPAGEVDLTGIFDDLIPAFIHLFVLLTTENYPDVMMPAFRSTARSFVFFGSFVCIGVFFILPMMLAKVMDAYWKATKARLKADRKAECIILLQGFNFLDPHNTGNVSLESWFEVMECLRPGKSRAEYKFLFDNIDKHKDGFVSVFEWLHVTTILRKQISQGGSTTSLRVPGATSPVLRQVREPLKRAVDHPAWDIAVQVTIVLYWVFFCIHWRGMDSQISDAVRITKTVLVGFLVGDVLLRFLARGRHFEFGSAIFGLPINVLEVIASIITLVDLGFDWSSDDCVFFYCVMGEISQVLRLLYKSNRSLRVLQIFGLMLSLSLRLILLMFAILFAYACVGQDLFANLVQQSPGYCVNDRVSTNTQGNYVELWCSTLIVFQILTTSDWHVLMMDVMSDTSRWAVFFFISCFVMTNFVMLSLMVGVFIEAFFKASTVRAQKLLREGQSAAPNVSAPAGGASEIGSMLEASANTNRAMDHIASGLKNTTQGSQLQSGPSFRERGDDLMSRMALNKVRGRQRNKVKPMSRCVAIRDYQAEKDQDLSLTKGDVLAYICSEGDCIKGELNGRQGWFEASCVLMVAEASPVQKPSLTRRGREHSRDLLLPSIRESSEIQQSSHLSTQEATPTLQVPPSEPQTRAGRKSSTFRVMESEIALGDLVEVTMFNKDELLELSRVTKTNLLKQHVQLREPRAKPMHMQAVVTTVAATQLGSPSDSPKPMEFRCDFENCGRLFESAVQLRVHGRTHSSSKQPSRQTSTSTEIEASPRLIREASGPNEHSEHGESLGKIPDWASRFAAKHQVILEEVEENAGAVAQQRAKADDG
eukprot:m.502148 g.502148  ORF g.502148 m.502148 type:complete len:1088 (+) comp57336_c1_seq4:84-3347(+)